MEERREAACVKEGRAASANGEEEITRGMRESEGERRGGQQVAVETTGKHTLQTGEPVINLSARHYVSPPSLFFILVLWKKSRPRMESAHLVLRLRESPTV